jgi:hypothetical protein
VLRLLGAARLCFNVSLLCGNSTRLGCRPLTGKEKSNISAEGSIHQMVRHFQL